MEEYREEVLQREWEEVYFQLFVLAFYDKIEWWCLCSNSNISIETIARHPECPWEWGRNGFSANPNLTMETVLCYSDKEWDWHYISKHPNITLEDIQNNLDKPWNWGEGGGYFSSMSDNPNLTMEMILLHVDEDWFWRMSWMMLL